MLQLLPQMFFMRSNKLSLNLSKLFVRLCSWYKGRVYLSTCYIGFVVDCLSLIFLWVAYVFFFWSFSFELFNSFHDNLVWIFFSVCLVWFLKSKKAAIKFNDIVSWFLGLLGLISLFTSVFTSCLAVGTLIFWLCVFL